jgi:hypothetical protein
MLETKMDCRETTPYTDSEIATHITTLATKWGLPLAYRWVTIQNTGTTTFSFQRLGFYGSHAEAYADSIGDKTDTKSGAYLNVMKNYAGTGQNLVQTISTFNTIAYTPITNVLSNTGVTGPVGNTGIRMFSSSGGGIIKIDLGDPITCSHIRFGNFTSIAPQNVRLKITLSTTKFADETEGSVYECKLKAAKNASGPSEGQFPLHSPSIETSSDPFLNVTDPMDSSIIAGSHINSCGIYVLVPDYTTLVSGFI